MPAALSMRLARGGRFTRNSLWLAAQDAYTFVVTLVVGVFCARYLGPEGYGILSYSMSFVLVFQAICQLGLNESAVDALVKQPERAGDIVGSALALRAIAAALSQLGLLACVSVIDGGNRLLLSITLLQGVSLFFDSRLVFDYFFQSRLEARNSAFAQMTGVTALCLTRVALLVARADVIWFAGATAVQSLVALCASAALFKSRARVALRFSLERAGRLMRVGAPFMLASAASVLYMQLDRLMIGAMLSGADVGFYSVADYAALVGCFVPAALITTARPLLLGLKREADFDMRFQALVFGVVALSCVLGLGLFALGPWAVNLVYGASYAPAKPLLRVLCFMPVFTMLNQARDVYLLKRGLNRYSLVFALMGAALNLLLNYIMILKWGVMGAAIATMCVLFALSVIAPAILPKTRPFARLAFASPARARDAFMWLKKNTGEEDA